MRPQRMSERDRSYPILWKMMLRIEMKLKTKVSINNVVQNGLLYANYDASYC